MFYWLIDDRWIGAEAGQFLLRDDGGKWDDKADANRRSDR